MQYCSWWDRVFLPILWLWSQSIWFLVQIWSHQKNIFKEKGEIILLFIWILILDKLPVRIRWVKLCSRGKPYPLATKIVGIRSVVPNLLIAVDSRFTLSYDIYDRIFCQFWCIRAQQFSFRTEPLQHVHRHTGDLIIV